MTDQAQGSAYGQDSTDDWVRCWRCEKLLAEKVTRPYKIVCVRCKATNTAPR